MKENSKIFLTTTLDCTYGIVKRYVTFLRIYVLYLGIIYLSTIVHSDIVSYLLKTFNYSEDIPNMETFVQNGDHFKLVFGIYVIILILTAICGGIQLASRFYAGPKERYKIVTDISEISAVLLVTCIIYSKCPIISLDHFFVMCIILGIYKFVSLLLAKKLNLNLKYFKTESVQIPAPMGKAVILSGNIKKEEVDEPKENKNENAEHQTLTVQKLIDKLEKVEEMDVSVRYGSVIVDATDVFECESDGVPFMCIDCAEVKKSE